MVREMSSIRLNARIQLTRPSMWHWEGEFLRIPAGEKGVIAPWKEIRTNKDGLELTRGKGCAVVFDTIKHPHYNGFPMCMHDVNISEYPDGMEEV